jgi:hypothetical protein
MEDLHQGVRYEEREEAVNQTLRAARTSKMLRELRNLGYRFEPADNPA